MRCATVLEVGHRPPGTNSGWGGSKLQDKSHGWNGQQGVMVWRLSADFGKIFRKKCSKFGVRQLSSTWLWPLGHLLEFTIGQPVHANSQFPNRKTIRSLCQSWCSTGHGPGSSPVAGTNGKSNWQGKWQHGKRSSILAEIQWTWAPDLFLRPFWATLWIVVKRVCFFTC